MQLNDLHVVTVISNPVRYKARYELFTKFEAHMKASGVDLHLVECAFGKRPFVISDASNPRHLQVRSSHELWHKENLINLGIQNVVKISPRAKYIAWIDADIEFVRKDWALETIHQLQHHKVVQLWSEAFDLGPNGQMIHKHESFGYGFVEDKPVHNAYGKFWHPGYAWAIRREILDKLGGLIDFAILGSGDHHMAKCFVGDVGSSIHKAMHPAFLKHMKNWEHRALQHVRRDVGYVPGIILHGWHGKKVNRGYIERWKILVNNQYNPETDIVRDCQGLYQLADDNTSRMITLRDELRAYFRRRKEDGTEL